MFAQLKSLFSNDIGIDLGTANSLVYVRDQGIVLREPSVVAIQAGTTNVLAVGEEAKRMLGRTPGNIVAIRPMKDGVIADFEVTSIMIKYFLGKVLSRRQIIKPRLVVAVPTGITSVEKRAVIEAAEQAGARQVNLVEEPMAAAIGAELAVDQPVGNMVVDIGGGTTEVAVISMFAIAYSESVRVAGDEANEAIMRYIQRERQIAISENMAENIKIRIGSAIPLQEPLKLEIPGKEILTGFPRTFTVTDEEVREAIQEPIQVIVDSVRRALEKTPPDLAGDLGENGFYLAGGGALLRGLDQLLHQTTGLRVSIAEDPLTAVARGAGRVIEDYRFYEQVFLN
jgi:rod shape-determining protein MreB